jgi:hypothetical protein
MLARQDEWPWIAAGLMVLGACQSASPGVVRDVSLEPAVDQLPAETFGTQFSALIFPILQRAGCQECHRTEQAVTSHWAVTTPDQTYQQLVDAPGFEHCTPTGGPIGAPQPKDVRVRPGDPDGSLLVRKLEAPWDRCGPFHGHMPPPPRLRMPAEDVATIRSWISAGAPR